MFIHRKSWMFVLGILILIIVFVCSSCHNAVPPSPKMSPEAAEQHQAVSRLCYSRSDCYNMYDAAAIRDYGGLTIVNPFVGSTALNPYVLDLNRCIGEADQCKQSVLNCLKSEECRDICGEILGLKDQ